MTSVAEEASRWMCGGRPSDRSVRAHRIGGGVRILGPAAQAAGSVAGDRWNCKRCNGRGDAVRLPARGFFEGYEPASRGSHRVVLPPDSSGGGTRSTETRRTPGSAAGCNTPATSGDGKPPRWCKTTRAAPVPGAASRGPHVATRAWPGPGSGSMEGRTDESQERRPRGRGGPPPWRDRPGQCRGFEEERRSGRLRLARVTGQRGDRWE